MASVFQKCKRVKENPCDQARCGHKWTVQWRTAGGREGTQKEKSFARKTDADAFATTVEADKIGLVVPSAAHVVTGSTKTIETWCSDWLKDRILAESSREVYASFFRTHLYPHMGGKTLGELERSDFTSLVQRLVSAKLKPVTIIDRVGKLNGIFEAAVKAGELSVNHAAELEVPRRAERRVDDTEIPTPLQVMTLADAINPRYRLAVWAQGGAGLRVSESLALGPSMLLEDVFRCRWQATPDRSPTLKALKHRAVGDYRDVPAAKPLISELEGHLTKYGVVTVGAPDGRSETIATHQRGILRNRGHFSEALERAHYRTGMVGPDGKPLFHPHSLRHCFVSVALAARVPIHEVSRWIGHRNIQVTVDIYGHLMPAAGDRLRDAITGALWAA